jgi:chromosome segregation ATPase
MSARLALKRVSYKSLQWEFEFYETASKQPLRGLKYFKHFISKQSKECAMEHETERSMETLTATLDRLAGAAGLLEQTVKRLEDQQTTISGQVEKIVATVEQGSDGNERVRELEERLQEAMAQLSELRAQAGVGASSGRKTVAAATASLLAKQGISNLDSIEAGSLDAALSALSIEQRIAVKSQLLRAGLLG